MSHKAEKDYIASELREDHLLITLSGDWSMKNHPPAFDENLLKQHTPRLDKVVIDTKALASWDSSLVLWLVKCRAFCNEQGIVCEDYSLPEDLKKLLLFAKDKPLSEDNQIIEEEQDITQFLGKLKASLFEAIKTQRRFLGEIIASLRRLIDGEAQWRWQDFLAMVHACGVKALPIITLISLLIGMIVAFLGAVVLKKFGADIYVSNLIGWGVLREMGVMMVGIILAGRTGAAFAAHIGSMKVNEELDALKAMGISITDFIILPRLLALFLMMPLLTVYADIIGILGGFFISQTMMNIAAPLFFTELWGAVSIMDFLLGIFKSFVFGILIALSGCLRGIQCGSSADAVGEAATSAVVTGITLIIIANALIDWIAALNGI